MLAEILDVDRVIYLDSDLLVRKDLTALYWSDLEDKIIGVSGVGVIESSLEHSFFVSLGMDKSATYFNSGVMLIDLKKWRQEGITQKCLDFADQHAKQLLTADQTVLNYVFYRDKFVILDDSYNCALYPDSDKIRVSATGSVFHFVGAPKPWDLLGEVYHGNNEIYDSVLVKTEYRNYKSHRDLTFTRIKRAFRLSRSYLRLTLKKTGLGRF
jgi:lipopolysaccharide biosynthesis glycosyltransferase